MYLNIIYRYIYIAYCALPIAFCLVAQKEFYVNMLKEWFVAIDSDNSGLILHDEFIVALKDPPKIQGLLVVG